MCAVVRQNAGALNILAALNESYDGLLAVVRDSWQSHVLYAVVGPAARTRHGSILTYRGGQGSCRPNTRPPRAGQTAT